MNTRTENINNNAYCAYCGKELRDYASCYIHSYPETPLVCNCEKAKRELELYDELKKMYNTPLAESLIDMKVEIYKNLLLSGKNRYEVTLEDTNYSCASSNKTCADKVMTKLINCSYD